MGIIFNVQICQLLNCSLPIEEILQVHGQNRSMVNLPGVDFRSQSREMPLIQHCCFELYFSITNYVVCQDSDSSDEGEGISVDELKQTDGYRLFVDALDAHVKANSTKE